ncbi:unnamed protein product [Dibothriocephalus latus]|uniref:Uncharacterized protein n=1 Tax=Dibothriocephalus latus TaxID=60516 RepID=A0A3P7Q2F8_DIBLA|nr:unnamed protein product [Dibothriocephalus latus]
MAKPKLVGVNPACSAACGTLCELEKVVIGWHNSPSPGAAAAKNDTLEDGSAMLM